MELNNNNNDDNKNKNERNEWKWDRVIVWHAQFLSIIENALLIYTYMHRANWSISTNCEKKKILKKRTKSMRTIQNNRYEM